MAETWYNSQSYAADVAGSLSSFGFMLPYYTQTGLTANSRSESADNIDSVRARKKRNKMSFTMKRIPNADAAVAPVNDEKLSSFACRADVIYKKILRDFRRYFISDFKDKTGYKDCKSDRLSANVPQLLANYVDAVFGSGVQHRDDVICTVGSLIFPSQQFTMVDSELHATKAVNKIHDTLYKFSITKVDRLLEDRNVCFLLKYFVCDQSNTRALIESSRVCQKSYQTAFDLIEKRVDAVLSANNFH